MNVKSTDVYLNTLCLAAYAPGTKSMELARATVKMFDEISSEERTLMKPVTVLYVNLLRDVSKGNLNLSNRAEVADTLLRLQQKPEFKDKLGSFSYSQLADLLTPAEPVSDSRIRQLYNNVRRNITWMRAGRTVRKAMIHMNQCSTDADEEKQEKMMQLLLADADALRSDLNPTDLANDEVPIDEIDMSDPQSIMRGLTAQQKKNSGSKIRFGWQGLNRMYGPKGGASYGEMEAVAARSHNYKSGLLMDKARWICTLNLPPDTNGLKPIVLFISLENEVQENLLDWYKKLYVNAYRKDPGDLSNEEIVEYVMMRFNKNGFRMIAKRRMGENFGYAEYEKMVEEEEAKYGGKVVATVLDYITLCRRCPEDRDRNDAVQLQKLAERFHNHSAHHDIFFTTGLQLETAASQLAVSGKHNIVKQYGEFHLADCKGLKRELDLLFFMEIEKNHRQLPYLCIAWNKHRYVHNTPAEDKFACWRFTNFGILDDVDGEDTTVHDIYADNDGDEDQPGVNATHVIDVF